MLILVLKTIHVLGAVLFLGTGLGSAYYKFRAGASKDARVVAWCDAEVVRADWIFTVPAGLIMPVSGLWLVVIYRLPLQTPWVWQGLLGYAIAGITWLPAAYLQIRMRTLSKLAAAEERALPAEWYPMQRTWALLGLPSLTVTTAALWTMVTKQAALRPPHTSRLAHKTSARSPRDLTPPTFVATTGRCSARELRSCSRRFCRSRRSLVLKTCSPKHRRK